MPETGPAAPPGGDEEEPGGLPSPLAAIDDMRAAAKWTLAAAGAVGATLISGGPLVAVGQVHGAGNAVLAGLGLLIAIGGVGAAIWFTSQVLMPRLTTPATLLSPELAEFRAEIAKSPEHIFGVVATDVPSLLRHQVVAVNLARLLAGAKDGQRRQLIEAQLERAKRNADRADPYVRWLLMAAHAWQVKADLRLSRLVTLGGAVLVVIGAVLFFSVTGSSEPTYVPVLTPAVTATPPSAASPAAR